jgi:hypothetical protein
MKQLAVIALLVGACGDDGGSSTDAATSGSEYTLASCTTSIASSVPEPYASRMKCVTATVEGTDIVITTTGLPPHRSYYYGASSPNYEAWDDRGGLYHPNPNTLQRKNTTITIPMSPTSRNLTITSALVDGVTGTSSSEYRMGAAGVALDSVILFNPLAAPGDDIADEQYTFDPFNAHPAPDGTYHYHRDSPGPQATGTDALGVMCDGTWVLGCKELDSTDADESDLDAQNGHVHAVVGLGTRYHVHICSTFTTHTRPYTPEIQSFSTCNVR